MLSLVAAVRCHGSAADDDDLIVQFRIVDGRRADTYIPHTPMLGLALTVLRFAAPYLICAAVLGVAYWKADYGWCNGACRAAKEDTAKQAKRADTAEAKLAELDRQRIAQEERWAQLTAAEEQRAKETEAKRVAKHYKELAASARSDPDSRSVAVPYAPRRLLGDAYAAAEATAEPDEAAPANSATVADMAAWGIEMLEWADTCKAAVEGWQRWYSEISKDGNEFSP